MSNNITSITRQLIADEIETSKISICGKLNDAEFLNRIFDLEQLPSQDKRYKTAFGDISCHSRFGDYETITWMFNDSRFNLLHCNDELFIRFICETLNPAVMHKQEDLDKLKAIYSRYLRGDGYELYIRYNISSMPIYGVRKIETGIDIQEKSIQQYLDSEYVLSKVNLMKSMVKTNTDLALGSAKELLEIVCKSILSEKKISYTDDMTLSKLFKETINSVGILESSSASNKEQADRSIRQILSGLNRDNQGVTELRNGYGSGHGKEASFKRLEPQYVEFVVSIVSNIVVFILQINGETTPLQN